MQVYAAKVQHNGTSARPASGSAFLAGHVVTVTVPTRVIGDRLLAIGDDWTELRVSTNDDVRQTVEVMRDA